MRQNKGKTMQRNRPNIILIVIDALRPDHLSCNGYPTLTSPNIDKFAEECISFQKTFSASPSTVGSIPSILTGLYPSFHGTGVDGNILTLSGEISTLPEILKRQGYTTVGFNTNAYMVSKHGYDKGYISYFDLFPSEKKDELITRVSRLLKKKIQISKSNGPHKGIICSEEVNKHVIKWLKNFGLQPFFMWIHYMDVHAPYLPREPYFSQYSSSNSKDQIISFKKQLNQIYFKLYKDPNLITLEERQLLINCYDSEIRYFDQNFKRLLCQLKKQSLLDKTIIVLTSDHGEEFWEHGKWGHNMRMYDVNLHVPLLIRFPHVPFKRKTIQEPIRNIDIFSTILDFLNIKLKYNLSGASFMPFIHEEHNVQDLSVISEGGGIQGLSLRTYIDRIYSIRTSNWKYIKNVTKNVREIYNLNNDPNELINLANDNSVANIMKKFDIMLNEFIISAKKFKKDISLVEVDDKIIKRLKDLGYI